jgi:hypothetical protein
MKRRRTTHRNAFTLVELSVSMSAGSALLVLVIGLVHQSMSLVSLGQRRSEHHQSVNRLATDFRFDVHRAVQCTVESPVRIQLHLSSDQVVTYQAAANRVTRQQPLDGGSLRREAFVLSDASTVTFELIDQPRRVVLSMIDNSHAEERAPKVYRKIAAVIGRLTDHEQGDVSP